MDVLLLAIWVWAKMKPLSMFPHTKIPFGYLCLTHSHFCAGLYGALQPGGRWEWQEDEGPERWGESWEQPREAGLRDRHMLWWNPTPRALIWLWLKKVVPNCHLGIWNQRLKPAKPQLFTFEPYPCPMSLESLVHGPFLIASVLGSKGGSTPCSYPLASLISNPLYQESIYIYNSFGDGGMNIRRPFGFICAPGYAEGVCTSNPGVTRAGGPCLHGLGS